MQNIFGNWIYLGHWPGIKGHWIQQLTCRTKVKIVT